MSHYFLIYSYLCLRLVKGDDFLMSKVYFIRQNTHIRRNSREDSPFILLILKGEIGQVEKEKYTKIETKKQITL